MELKLTGQIKTIKEVVSGTTKSGDEWKKVEFVIANNDGYQGGEQVFCFEIFGAEKVDKFLQYNKVGDTVDVDFNIRTNEWKEKHFTSLQACKVFKVGVNTPPPPAPAEAVQEGDEPLPF